MGIMSQRRANSAPQFPEGYGSTEPAGEMMSIELRLKKDRPFQMNMQNSEIHQRTKYHTLKKSKTCSGKEELCMRLKEKKVHQIKSSTLTMGFGPADVSNIRSYSLTCHSNKNLVFMPLAQQQKERPYDYELIMPKI